METEQEAVETGQNSPTAREIRSEPAIIRGEKKTINKQTRNLLGTSKKKKKLEPLRISQEPVRISGTS